MSEVNLAIIGCGLIAQNYHVLGLNLLRRNNIGKINLGAVCDTTVSKAYDLAEYVGEFQSEKPRVYSNYLTMLEKETDLDAVDICTEPRNHHTIAISCLDTGRHVLVEKPLGITMRASLRMNEAARRNNVILATAENLRRTTVNRTIKWALNEGLIGEPRLTTWQEMSYDLGIVDGTPWRHDKFEAGGGWVLDVGSHLGDLLRYLLGEVDEVYAVVETLEPIRYQDWPERKKPINCKVEDTSMAILRFKNGLIGQWNWTKSAPGDGLLHQAIYGTLGSIDWQHGLNRPATDGSTSSTVTLENLVNMMRSSLDEECQRRFFPGGIGTVSHLSSFWGEPGASYAVELLDFAEAILDHREPEIDGIAGAKAEAVPIAIFESSFSGKAVKVSDVESCKVENYQNEINERLGIE